MEIKGHKVYAHQLLVETAFNLTTDKKKKDTISMELLFTQLIRMATQTSNVTLSIRTSS